MMTVAAIIEQAQNRWMEHPLMYNRGLQFQGSYCKYLIYFFISLFTLQFLPLLFNFDLHHHHHHEA